MNPDSPKVSVGLPVYNGENFLEKALDSILSQSFADFELIISDNGSVDKTADICQAYAAKDSRIRYYRSPCNRGASWNHNQVVQLATGEYFKWAAHDDICAPDYLQRCVDILDSHPSAVLCYGITMLIDAQGQPLKRIYDHLDLRQPTASERYQKFHERFRHSRICNPILGLIRTSALKETPLLGNYAAADIPLLAELVLRGEFYEVPDEILLYRRMHNGRSCVAYRRLSMRAVWFDPAAKGKVHLPRWRQLQEYLKSVNRVPLQWCEKRQCYLQLGRWFFDNWHNLRHDLVIAIKQSLGLYPIDA